MTIINEDWDDEGWFALDLDTLNNFFSHERKGLGFKGALQTASSNKSQTDKSYRAYAIKRRILLLKSIEGNPYLP